MLLAIAELSRRPDQRIEGRRASVPNVSISALTQRAARVNQRETSRGTKLHAHCTFRARFVFMLKLTAQMTCNGGGKYINTIHFYVLLHIKQN
jgi:hypothetical protein